MDYSKKEFEPTLGMTNFPWQKWRAVMDGGCALQKGTIFEELALPFYGTKAACDSNFTKMNAPRKQEYQHQNDYRRNNMGRGCGCR